MHLLFSNKVDGDVQQNLTGDKNQYQSVGKKVFCLSWHSLKIIFSIVQIAEIMHLLATGMLLGY
jgi:hypothetical protein